MSDPRPRLTKLQLAAYGFPGLPLAAVTLPVYILIPKFYAVEMGLGLATVGLLMLVSRLWDVVTDPLVGFLSDKTQGRFGRRKPWLLAGLPVTAVAAYALFLPPDNVGPVYLLVVTLFLYLGWTMATLPYNAWGAELSGNYHQRTTITSWREGFVVVGTLFAAAVPELIGGAEGTKGEGLAFLGITLAIMLPIAAIVVAFGLPDTAPPVQERPRMGEILRGMRANKPFWRLLLAWLLNGFANGLPATLFLLFVQYTLQTPEKSGVLLLTYFITAVVGLPVWLWLGRKWGKHRCWSAAMIWACIWFAFVPFLAPGDADLFLVICVATGIALGADLILPSSMQADVVDVDTAKGGSAKTGAYFALWGMAQKLALALAVGIAFPLLELAGLDTTAVGQSIGSDGIEQDGVWLIAILYSVVPILFKLAAIGLIWGHPVTEDMQQNLQKQISRGQHDPVS